MCEYLRPVVALEWLKACCTDMITWMSSFSTGRNTEHDDSKELPVMATWKIWNCQTLHKSLEITNALIAVHVCTLRMLMKNTVQLVQQVHIHRCLIVHNAITIVNSAKVCVLANL